MSAVVRWTFTDPVTSETYSFEANPDAATPTEREKTFFTAPTTAPTGFNNISEGRDKPTTGSFAGKVFTEAGYLALNEWFSRPRVVTLVDDLGRSSDVILEQISFDRAPHRHHPFRHTYTVQYHSMETVT